MPANPRSIGRVLTNQRQPTGLMRTLNIPNDAHLVGRTDFFDLFRSEGSILCEGLEALWLKGGFGQRASDVLRRHKRAGFGPGGRREEMPHHRGIALDGFCAAGGWW